LTLRSSIAARNASTTVSDPSVIEPSIGENPLRPRRIVPWPWISAIVSPRLWGRPARLT